MEDDIYRFAQFLGVRRGGTLPPIRFFVPKPDFITHIAASYGGRLLYEIGAGVGHVSRALADAGLNVSAIDLYHRDEAQFSVTIADATTFQYNHGSVVLICRPSHEGFVEKAISTALICGVREILYVGLRKNVAADLGRFRRSFRSVLRDIGAAGENLYVLANQDG
jgi:hypothetical protein